MLSKFKKGDLVILKSGGPKMTVSKVDISQSKFPLYLCKWFAKKNLNEELFEEVLLNKVKEHSLPKEKSINNENSLLLLNTISDSRLTNSDKSKPRIFLINNKKHEVFVENSLFVQKELPLLIYLFSKIKSDSIFNNDSSTFINLNYDEFLYLPFIASKQYRKSFNNEEKEFFENILNSIKENKINKSEGINEILKIKKVFQADFEVFALKMENLKIDISIYEEDINNLIERKSLKICKKVVRNEFGFSFYFNNELENDWGFISKLKDISIPLLSDLSDLEISVYLFIESIPNEKNKDFNYSTFVNATNKNYKEQKVLRYRVKKALAKLEEKEYLKINKEPAKIKKDIKYFISKV